VASGSCGLSLIALHLNPENPLPLLSAIVTGIGFLGAGALIKTSDKIFGFTNAASIWIFAILGLTVGIGAWFTAGLLYLVIWIVIIIDNFFEKWSLGSYQKKLTIVLRCRYSKQEIKKILNVKKYKTLAISSDREKQLFSFTMLAEGSKRRLDSIPEILDGNEDVLSYSLE